MKAKDLKVGFPFYHVQGSGAYGTKGEYITRITRSKGVMKIETSNDKGVTKATYYVGDNKEVEIAPGMTKPKWGFIGRLILEGKAYLRRR